MNYLGKNIKYLTATTEINQNQLAQKLNLTRQNIQKIINGGNTKIDTLIEKSKIYNISIDNLLKVDLKNSKILE